MARTMHLLPELIKTGRDGAVFYEEAAQSVGHRELRRLFLSIARAKSCLASDLQENVTAKSVGSNGAAGEVKAIRETYGDLRGELDPVAYEHVEQLESAERKMLDCAQQVLKDRRHSYVVRVCAQQYIARANANQQQLRLLKRALARWRAARKAS